MHRTLLKLECFTKLLTPSPTKLIPGSSFVRHAEARLAFVKKKRELFPGSPPVFLSSFMLP